MKPLLRPVVSRRAFSILTAAALLAGAPAARAALCTSAVQGTPTGLPNPILFVTQFPIAADFATVGSTFANHRPGMQSAGRGGDLWVIYPDGLACNLTREAGLGASGSFQGASAIAVRDPEVHWSGTRALFSMVVGAPEEQFDVIETRWQIYEATGLGRGVPLTIARVSGQPAEFNNVAPVYSPDGWILFTTDRPRDGRVHLYPQHDEYESTATVSGLWRLHPGTGALDLMDHAPSGVFTPLVDSFGRVLFTRWDHLQRDQQADGAGNPYEAFDWESEEAGAATGPPSEVFPEPRIAVPGGNLNGLRFNHFFPWQLNPDGTELETLAHLGRHDLHAYFDRSLNDDPNLEEFIADGSGRFNPNPVENLFQLAEDPTAAGAYLAVDAPEFQTHASGVIARFVAPPGTAADRVAISYVTHPDTGTVVGEGDTPPATHTGHYRDPLAAVGGAIVAAHTAETRADANEGNRPFPDPRYDFRLKRLVPDGTGHLKAGPALTPGLARTVSFWDPDVLVTYGGPFWELQPVEVRARPVPSVLATPLPTVEAQVFAEEAVDPEGLSAYLAQHDLALLVTRNVTTRDGGDRQQPFNLRVPGGVATVGAGGAVYDVSYLQLFQADQVRGLGGAASPNAGRRPLARALHDPAAVAANPPSSGPEGGVTVAADGSAAAFVPAHRALSWQLTDPVGEPVVRERYWITFQPGELRVCTSCHGLSRTDQAGQPPPANPPEALRQLLRWWKERVPLFADGFESGDLAAWSAASP